MSLPLQLAWRYFRRPTDRLVSAVGAVSVLGLVIGVMALVISMALMTGYREDLQRKLLGGNAELFMYAIDGSIRNVERTLVQVRAIEGIAEASPVIFHQALVASELHATGEQVMLKGIDPTRAASSPMIGKILNGRKSFRAADATPGIAIGRYLADKLRVRPGDALTLTVPAESAESFLPRSGTFVVTTVYQTGFFEFDARWLFLDLTEAQQLLGSGGANLIEMKLLPGADLDSVSERVREQTRGRYAVTDWREMNRQLFSLLRIQQIVLFIVIGLIVFVSTFNIVSTLIMTAHEKRREIGILMSMGGDRRLIRNVFIWYGTLVGVAGTVTGIAAGTLICWIITKFELISFGPEIAEVYFVSSIPFVTKSGDLAAIALFATAVCYSATLIPSMRAARMNPVEALRYE